MLPPKRIKHPQQVEDGELIGGNRDLAALKLAQLAQGVDRASAHVYKSLRIFQQHRTGIGQQAFARRTVKQRFANFALQLANNLADRRLSAPQALSCAREAALLRYCQKCFELIEVYSH